MIKLTSSASDMPIWFNIAAISVVTTTKEDVGTDLLVNRTWFTVSEEIGEVLYRMKNIHD